MRQALMCLLKAQNNFSEVNKEMIAEMKEEINKGNYDEAKIIADDIEANGRGDKSRE